jgi:molybdate-binding protein
LAALVDNIILNWEQIQADWFNILKIVKRYQYPEIKEFEKNLQEEVINIYLSQGSRHFSNIGKMLIDL